MDHQKIIYTAIDKFSASIVKSTDGMRSVFEEAWRDFATLWQTGSELPGNETACVAGCDCCCHYTVSLRAHEIVQVLEQIRTNFSASEIEETLKRAKQNRRLMKKLTHEKIEQTNIRCPLLSEDGLCRCYEVRPLNCRRNNSRNAELCRQFHNDPTAPLASDSAEDIDQLTSIVGYALNEAFAENEYDDAIYYLNNGIYEGLKKPKSIRRWQNKGKAFSRSAESKEFD